MSDPVIGAPHVVRPTPVIGELADHVVEALLAQEARRRAVAGDVPEMAPVASGDFEESVREQWRQCEARLEENGVGGTLARGHRYQVKDALGLMRDVQCNNSKNIMFYPTTPRGGGKPSTTRVGLWLCDSGSDALHHDQVNVATLAEHTRWLGELERMLGVQGVINDLGVAESQARSRYGG